MKNLNLNLVLPLILTFMLQACVPDSLTKFNKEVPKKTAVAATTTTPTTTVIPPTTDPTVIVQYPANGVTTFSYTDANSTIALSSKDLRVGKIEKLTAGTSDLTNYGSLADPNKKQLLFVKCALDITGPLLTRTLPFGMSLDPATCNITGTPTAPYYDIIMASPANITYTVQLLYKGSTYSGPGTESILTGTVDLASFYFDSTGVEDTLPIDYPAVAPAGFSYTEKIANVDTAVTNKDMLVGTPIQFNPLTLGSLGTTADGVGGTLSSPTRSKYIFIKCSLDQSGPLSSRTLPPGLTLNTDTCLITGTPTAAFTDTTFGNMGGKVSYNIDLYYKGASYLGVGTELKVTTNLQLMAHVPPVLPPNFIAATTFNFALQGTTTPVTSFTYEVGSSKTYVPIVDGTLSAPDMFTYSLVSCTPDSPLPTGLTLTNTCSLQGTPTAVVASTAYVITLKYKGPTYAGPGSELSVSTASLLISANIKPTLLTYTQNDKLLFKLDTTTALVTNTESVDYDRAGLLTSSNGTTAVVKYIDSSTATVGVVRVLPLTLANSTGFVKNDFIFSAGGAIGKIQNVSGNTVYIERLTSSITFVATEGVMHKTTDTGIYGAPATTISSISSTYVFDMNVPALDGDDQYYSTQYNQSNITRVYEKGVAIAAITPIASAQLTSNGITYSIVPAMPAGLTFSTTTGSITGAFTNTLASTKFTITATNVLGSTSFVMYLSAIEAPKDLSYTTRELITVSTNASFNEGESLFQPLTAPLTESVAGQYLRKYGTTQMSIATVNGQFLEGASIDSGNAFYSAKTTVLANPVFYNIALTVSVNTVAAVGDYVSSSAGALGRVVARDLGTSTLFIQYLNAIATPVLFQEGNTISTGLTYSASAVTIDQVEADNMKLTLSAVPGAMLVGDDLTAVTAFPAVGDLGGYIHKISGSDIYVSDISRRSTQPQYFRKTQRFDNNETMVTNRGSFTAVAHDNFYIVERGSKIEIKSNVSQGSGIIYSASPALPAGITLNSLTGLITGTPTYATPRTTYTISATNLVNATTFVFELETRDFFKISEKSGAPSFIFHKYGDSRGSRKCRINSTDIKSFSADDTSVNTGVLDVRCFLDAEEEDLHFNKLKILSSAGAGVCEYIQVYPYSFWQYAPTQSAKETPYAYVSGCSLSPTAPPTPESLCPGNHTSAGGPNCDEGSFKVTTHNWSMDSATPQTCSIDSQTVTIMECGGKKSNCLKGPVHDILSDAQLQSGSRSMVYSAFNGTVVTSTFSAPSDNADASNLRVANGTVKNLCTNTNTDANLWESNQAVLSDDNPLANGANLYYVVNCLDAAKDIKARIRITVRDWNKTFKIKDDIDYDLPGGAGTTLMNNTTSVFGKSNNDYFDWDDAYNGAAAVNAGTCAAPNFTTKYKFPEDQL